MVLTKFVEMTREDDDGIEIDRTCVGKVDAKSVYVFYGEGHSAAPNNACSNDRGETAGVDHLSTVTRRGNSTRCK